jgi:hypothetical protein
MRDLLLSLVFAWQAATARFFPDPAVEVEAARHWLEENIKHAKVLTPELIAEATSMGFSTGDLIGAGFDAYRNFELWRDMPVERIYNISRTISARPAWAVMDVMALLALDESGRVLAVYISSDRTTL